jgi:NAD(P)-dependent dehydrogenase (short-subunit alcohol dehydrogenase family)
MRTPLSFDLPGKVVVVTGAGRGIGRATTLAAAAAGASVVAASRTMSDLEGVREAVKSLGQECMAHRADVEDVDSLRSLVDAAVTHFGRIDGLVNNAGDNLAGPAVDFTVEQFDHLLNVNYRSVFFLSAMVAKVMMMQQVGGAIVSVASQAGLVGAPGRAPYSGAKAAVVNVTRTLAAEWASHQIRVNAVAPTFTRTPLAEEVLAGNPDLKRALTEKILLGRIAEPEEIAAPIVFLLSSAAQMITGQTLAVDGGWTIT